VDRHGINAAAALHGPSATAGSSKVSKKGRGVDLDARCSPIFSTFANPERFGDWPASAGPLSV